MLLKNDFYYIKNISQNSENQAEIEVSFNLEHRVFSAHFPDYPIVPGVCEIQIAVECISEILQQDFEMKNVKNVKFSNPIAVNNYHSVIYKLSWNETENNLLQVTGSIFNNETVFAKISMVLICLK